MTLAIILFAIIIPMGVLIGVITGQAIAVGSSVSPWVSERLQHPDEISALLAKLPFYEELGAHRETIFEKAGQIVGKVSSFLINQLSAATAGTVTFLFHLFLFLYTMFFFLKDGGRLLRRILYYLPLEDEAESRMLARFTSVTRATIKGTAVIGILQGGLAGLAFWILGIDAALFWATIMAVLSIIPGIGTGLVWIPAVVILAAGGAWVRALVLALWCAVIVGSIDNVVRPWLVGKDTQMHDILILFSTLGGILYFGLPGFIIGPIVAALFVTVWDIYGQVFQDILPAVHGWRPGDPESEEAPEAE
jgi:predicted PurR-regulated permease PerM